MVAKASRSIKLDFPKFTKEDLEGWLYQVKDYFSFHGIGNDSKIQVVGFHMIGKALSWVKGLHAWLGIKLKGLCTSLQKKVFFATNYVGRK